MITLIKISLNFALYLVDDHSGRHISNISSFTVNGRPFRPLQKPEGYLIFSGIEGEQFRLTADSRGYALQDCVVNAGDTVELRLLRRGDAAFDDCRRLRGSFQAGASVYALEEDTGQLRLQKLNCEEGRTTLSIFGYLLPGMVHQRFFLGKKETREEFVIQRRLSDGVYLADRPMRYSHAQGEPIVRAFHDVCDQEGRFAIPIPMEQQGKIDCYGYFGKGGSYGTARL